MHTYIHVIVLDSFRLVTHIAVLRNFENSLTILYPLRNILYNVVRLFFKVPMAAKDAAKVPMCVNIQYYDMYICMHAVY